MLLFLKSLWWR